MMMGLVSPVVLTKNCERISEKAWQADGDTAPETLYQSGSNPLQRFWQAASRKQGVSNPSERDCSGC